MYAGVFRKVAATVSHPTKNLRQSPLNINTLRALILSFYTKSNQQQESLTETAVSQKKKVPLGTKVSTGKICPESGVWRAECYSETAPIARGNRMPPYARKAVNWILQQYA